MALGRLREHIVLHMIGTPVEEPLRWFRSLPELVDRRRHPEWNSVRDESRAIKRLLKQTIEPTMNCVDIGCHLGLMISDIRRLAPAGRHMAFEPTPYKFAWLRQKYPDVDIRAEALSDRAGEAEFFYRPDHSGFSGLRSHGDAAQKTSTFRVRCARLDDLVGDRQIGFMKIDVEGAEPLVLGGAERTVRHSRPHILFECSMSGLALFNWSAAAIYQLLSGDFGYKIYLIQDFLDRRPALSCDEMIAAMSHPVQAFNFFAKVD